MYRTGYAPALEDTPQLIVGVCTIFFFYDNKVQGYMHISTTALHGRTKARVQ